MHILCAATLQIQLFKMPHRIENEKLKIYSINIITAYINPTLPATSLIFICHTSISLLISRQFTTDNKKYESQVINKRQTTKMKSSNDEFININVHGN